MRGSLYIAKDECGYGNQNKIVALEKSHSPTLMKIENQGRHDVTKVVARISRN